MEPAELITDFEGGLRKAIGKCYKTAILRGCWYHYKAAIRKMCGKLGLHSILKSDPRAKVIYEELMNLPLLPAENFSEGYSFIKKSSRDYGVFKELESLFDYYESYWLLEVCNVVNYQFVDKISGYLMALFYLFHRMKGILFPLVMQI